MTRWTETRDRDSNQLASRGPCGVAISAKAESLQVESTAARA